MQTLKHHTSKSNVAYYLIPYVFALVVFFFGFTDLPRTREEAFPLFGLFLLLLAVPIFIDLRRGRRSH